MHCRRGVHVSRCCSIDAATNCVVYHRPDDLSTSGKSLLRNQFQRNRWLEQLGSGSLILPSNQVIRDSEVKCRSLGRRFLQNSSRHVGFPPLGHHTCMPYQVQNVAHSIQGRDPKSRCRTVNEQNNMDGLR